MHATRKEVQRLEREIDTLTRRERVLAAEMVANATDHARLVRLQAELDVLGAERDRLESTWLETAATLEA